MKLGDSIIIESGSFRFKVEKVKRLFSVGFYYKISVWDTNRYTYYCSDLNMKNVRQTIKSYKPYFYF